MSFVKFGRRKQKSLFVKLMTNFKSIPETSTTARGKNLCYLNKILPFNSDCRSVLLREIKFKP